MSDGHQCQSKKKKLAGKWGMESRIKEEGLERIRKIMWERPTGKEYVNKY